MIISLRSSVLIVALLSAASSLQAAANRTWVSGVGDDANPCSRTAPCKTFAGAISKTSAGGEISVLDSGGFGAVTITKSITLNGGGWLASILPGPTHAVTVNALATDTVILRGLSLSGAGSGLNGIRYLTGKMLVVEDCKIDNFTQNGIDVALTGAGRLIVSRTSVTGGANGVRVFSTTGRVTAMLSDVVVQNATNGIDAVYGSTHISKSVVSNNSGVGIYAEGGTLNAEDVILMGNSVAARSQSGAVLRISDSQLYENLTGFGCGGGTLASPGNNRKGGNTGGAVAACAPNATISLQ